MSAPTRSLRAHPDLNQLRRQAKEPRSAFREGDADAVAEVNRHYRDAEATGAPGRTILHDVMAMGHHDGVSG